MSDNYQLIEEAGPASSLVNPDSAPPEAQIEERSHTLDKSKAENKLLQKLYGINESAETSTENDKGQSVENVKQVLIEKIQRGMTSQLSLVNDNSKRSQIEQAIKMSQIRESLNKELESHFLQTPDLNKKRYLESFALKIEQPAINIIDAKFCPMNPDYCLQLLKVNPVANLEVINHEGETSQKMDTSSFNKFTDPTTLKLRLIQKGVTSTINNSTSICYFKDTRGFIEFSQRICTESCSKHEYLAIYLRDSKMLRVIKIDRPISEIMQDLSGNETDESNYIISFKMMSDSIQRFTFDVSNRFLVGVGEKKLVIFNLENPTAEPVIYVINPMLYDYICDAVLISIDKETFMCAIACKVKNMNQVAVFDTKKFPNGGYFVYLSDNNGNQQQYKKVETEGACTGGSLKFNFGRDPEPGKFLVRMNSSKMQCVIYNYPDISIYTWDEELTVYKTPVRQVKNMDIHYIKPIHDEGDEAAFYFVGSFNYDTRLRVFSSNKSDVEMTITKHINPDTVTIYDAFLVKMEKENSECPYQKQGLFSRFQLGNMDYDEFNIDSFYYNYEQANNKETKEIDYRTDSYQISSFRVFSFNWPYFCYTGFDTNTIMIMNVYDGMKTLHRVLFPEEVRDNLQILKTYITDSMELIILVDLEASGVREEITYQLYKINLKTNGVSWTKHHDALILEHLCTFTHRNDGQGQVGNMFARGRNEETHENLQIYIVINKSIHVWKKKMAEPEEICSIIDCFDIMSSNSIVFRASSDGCEQIKYIQMTANDYQVGVFYEDRSSIIEIEAIKPDHVSKQILCLQKVNESRVVHDRYILLIFDFETRQNLLTIEIENQILIGLLRSGLFKFLDGWIYTMNSCCKIRMDLVKQRGQANVSSKDLLNVYHGLLPLDKNEIVKTSALQISMPYHRIAYMVSDRKFTTSRMLYIMPYPHERKIYLTKETPNSNYFYSTFDQPLANGTNQSQTMILANNLNQHQCFIFCQRGLVVNRIDYADLIDEYGLPVACSPNGFCFIFKKVVRDENDKEKFRDQKRTIITVLQLQLSGFKFIKQFNQFDAVNSCYNSQTSKVQRDHSDIFGSQVQPNQQALLQNSSNDFKYSEQHSWMLTQFMAEFEYFINDKMDIAILITQRDKTIPGHTKLSNFEKPRCTETGKCCSHMENIVYFQTGEKGMEKTSLLNAFRQSLKMKIDPPLKELLFFNTSIHHPKFRMNGKYFIFFSVCRVEFFDMHLQMEKKREDQNFEQIRFHINEKETSFHYIKDVLYGSNPDIIAIVIKAKEQDQVMIWDLAKNIEIDLYDVDSSFHICWSCKGDPIICTPGKTIYPLNKCSINAYTHPDFNEIKKKIQQNERICTQGHSFDMKNHNWLILREYLSLSFSYMTFVIRESIERDSQMLHGMETFDPEPYNYVFNRYTFFLNNNLMKNDHNLLQKVLQNFQRHDPTMIELLHYMQVENDGEKGEQKFVSPLHLALKSGNNRSVEIVLDFMSKIEQDASSNFSPLFHNLTNFKSFYVYLEQLPTQTIQLRNKQVLRVDDAHDDHIVSMAGSQSIYLDDQFFAREMHEEEDEKSYPVDIKATQIGWLVNSIEGERFLKALYMTENLDIYKNTFIKIIIEFLYNKFKKILIKIAIPSFALQIFLLNLGIYFYESLHDQTTEVSEIDKNSYQFWLQVTSLCISVIFLTSFTYNFIRRPAKLYTEVPLAVTSIFLCYQWFTADYSEHTRELTVVVYLLLFQKVLYYLKLFDQLAPLLSILNTIEKDIRGFMVVLILVIIMFATCFRMIGLNQVEFDNAPPESIEYYTVSGSLWYMWNLSLGQFDNNSFVEGKFAAFLSIMFVICSFILLVVMMNMLIAIMGDTFASQSAVSSQLRVKDHLKFILDHLFIGEYALPEDQKFNYLITAFNSANSDENKMDNMMHSLCSKLSQLEKTMISQFNEMEKRNGAKNKELKNMVMYIVENDEKEADN